MKLVAMMIVRNEADRYLHASVASLLEFVDEVRILDDGSDDHTEEVLQGQFGKDGERVVIAREEHSRFFHNESEARQTLLLHAMAGHPTHILAIDADEFIADGAQLRMSLEDENPRGVWSLSMEEIWEARDDRLMIRQDGGWKAHPVGILFWVPPNIWENRQLRRQWRIPPRALACGRVPLSVAQAANRSNQGFDTGTQILHFGWACKADRDARYQRYVTHDGGKFHAGTHIHSIMWDDERVKLSPRTWPAGMDKPTVFARANREPLE